MRAAEEGAGLDALRCLPQKVLGGSVAAERLPDQPGLSLAFVKNGLGDRCQMEARPAGSDEAQLLTLTWVELSSANCNLR